MVTISELFFRPFRENTLHALQQEGRNMGMRRPLVTEMVISLSQILCLMFSKDDYKVTARSFTVYTPYCGTITKTIL